jgi:hypothetical protein
MFGAWCARAITEVLEGRAKIDRHEARVYAFRFAPERVASVYASAYHSLLAAEATVESVA